MLNERVNDQGIKIQKSNQIKIKSNNFITV